MNASGSAPLPSRSGAVLRFGGSARFACALLLAGVVAAVVVVWEGRLGAAGLRAAIGAAALLVTLTGVEVFGVAHRLVPGGIERVAPWRRRALLRWPEIVSVEWVERTGWYELRARSGDSIRVYRQLTALPDFARAALDGIPAPVLDARPGVREGLEQLASSGHRRSP